MHPLSVSAFVLALAGICTARDSNSSASAFAFPLGSPQRCLTISGDRIPIFEVLAGGGWDNLRNRDMAMIMELNYSRCRTTDDGRYLIPDNLYTIPIKSSAVDTYAELIEHWGNYTSTTSSSINVHAGGSFLGIGASGSFSSDYQSVKSHQYFDKSVTTRVQVRYARYIAKLTPGSAVSEEFRRRLRQIGAHIRSNRTDLARYESQLITRDFGTHVITSLDVGAVLSQVDNIESSFAQNFHSNKQEIKASASASFFGSFDFGMDYSHSTSTQTLDGYKKARTSSKVETWGGPVFRPKNYTANDWSKAIENDMVAIDRSGDPLYYVINDVTLPDMPTSTMADIRNYVKEAVELYYKHNTYRGCTRREYPNFSFQANVDDDTCEADKTNFTFGGVYQTCNLDTFLNEILCKKLRQKNPMTGDYSCPSGYEAIQISPSSQRQCHKCWLFFHCCQVVPTIYTAYWCAAKGSVPQNSGFLFGGLYTSTVGNRVTGSSSCPAEFYPLHILDNLAVCVSDDYELGTSNAIPFGGFFTCNSGNPLAMKEKSDLMSSSKPSKLEAFMMESGASTYPKACPKGYSQHLAVNDRGCEVHYCVMSGALSPQGHPKIHLPPFMKIPNDEPEYIQNIVMSEDGTMWASMEDAKEFVAEYLKEHNLPSLVVDDVIAGTTGTGSGGNSGGGEGKSGGLSGGAVAAISIVVTLAFVAGVVVFVRIFRRRRGGGLYRQDI